MDSDVTVRPARWPEDLPALQQLVTSFETDIVLRVEKQDLTVALVNESVTPFRKRYEIDAADCGRLSFSSIAEKHGEIVGFVAAILQDWNRRMEIQHLYVSEPHRSAGIATRLLAEVESFARTSGARSLWVETQNINLPAVRFYLASGFQWCGFDESLYDPRDVGKSEIALFFSREIP